MKQSNTLEKFNRYIFVIPILIFIYINFPLINTCVRGEHWMLLYRYVENVPLLTKIQNIALFAFPGVQRPQFLAFFVPYIPFLFFGINFIGYFIFSFSLHIAAGALIVQILRKTGADVTNQFWAFSLFILSYACIDVVNWTFFSYVQVNTILILASIYWLMMFLDTKTVGYFHLQSLAILIACFLYEVSIVVFLVQIFIFILFKIDKKIIYWSCTYTILTMSIVLLVFMGIPNESDADHLTNIAIIYRIIIFIKNILLSYSGLYPVEFNISNIVFLTNQIINPITNFLNLTIFGICGILMTTTKYRHIAKSLRANRYRFFILLNVVILGTYIAVLCYARGGETADAFEINSYLDSQPRYYYLPIAILTLLIFSIPMPTQKWKNLLISAMLGLMLIGNCLNSARLVGALKPYYIDSLTTVTLTKNEMHSQSIPINANNFIKVYTYAWMNHEFILPQRDPDTAEFIYNSVNLWSNVLPKVYDAKFNRNLHLLIR